MKLWPLFGGANQLLAALALLVVTMYLRKKGGLKFIFTGIPCIVMLTISCSAIVKTQMLFIEQKSGDYTYRYRKPSYCVLEKAELAKQKAELDKARAEIEKDKAEIEKAMAEIERARAEIEKAKTEAEKAKAEAERVKSEANRQASEVERLKK